MGLISRKLFPACETMCVCCPALQTSSRKPVKRYKKLLADIFPKSSKEPPSERRIVKLCEYAAKNPSRIPKIAKFLEDRCYKELRSEHIKFINIVSEAYNKLLSVCKGQMAYYAVSLLNVVDEMLSNTKRPALKIMACQTLTRFIYSQVDGTYTYNIEAFVSKVCILAREKGEEHEKRCLRASSLQCLSAMVWFMAEFSHIFNDLDEIVHAILDNYETDSQNDGDGESAELNHNWVDEVVRSEGRCAAGSKMKPSNLILRPRPGKRDPLNLTREEIEMPKIWVQICIQRMVELAQESVTMRRILDPMFVHFDSGRHWVPLRGLAISVMSDMCYFMESPGDQQLLLTSVIHHLDHKNVSHDPQAKSNIIQLATYLARQIRSEARLSDVGFISDLCRHLRKSFQATTESTGEQEFNMNTLLQNAIEECFVEIAKGIADAHQLLDMMAITLENLPSVRVGCRPTIRSLIVLARTIPLASASTLSQKVFPEALLVQLLKVMLHPDPEVRIGAHQIFSALLIPSSGYPIRDGFNYPRKCDFNTESAFASITTLLERLRKEKDVNKLQKHVQDDFNGISSSEEQKQGQVPNHSPNFDKISSILDKTTTSLIESEPSMMKFSEDQIAQLLSAFWLQANLPDNLPPNVEAIAHSYCLTLISVRLKNARGDLVVRFFQLSLSLRNMSLDPNNCMVTGTWSPSYRRLVFVLSTAMLMFAAKLYQIHHLIDLTKPLVEVNVDPYLAISDDFQIFLKPSTDLGEYGSAADNQVAMSTLFDLRDKVFDSDKTMVDIIVQSLSSIVEMDNNDLAMQLSEKFTPDEAFMFGQQTIVDLDREQPLINAMETLCCDEDYQTNTVIEDDVMSESSVADLPRIIPRMPASPSMSNIVSIGKLLESALEVAGQVAGTSVSTSPLPYGTMASQCEALGSGTRQKLSSWLINENHSIKMSATAVSEDDGLATKVVSIGGNDDQVALPSTDPWLALRLPPASPFDNFLRAAHC